MAFKQSISLWISQFPCTLWRFQLFTSSSQNTLSPCCLSKTLIVIAVGGCKALCSLTVFRAPKSKGSKEKDAGVWKLRLDGGEKKGKEEKRCGVGRRRLPEKNWQAARKVMMRKLKWRGTENCWLGREAAAMGPESWSCSYLKSLCVNMSNTDPPCGTHITETTHGGVWLWICFVLFFFTSLKQQKNTNVWALEAVHSCVTNKQHCIIHILPDLYTV